MYFCEATAVMNANSKRGGDVVEIQGIGMFECIREEVHNEYKSSR